MKRNILLFGCIILCFILVSISYQPLIAEKNNKLNEIYLFKKIYSKPANILMLIPGYLVKYLSELGPGNSIIECFTVASVYVYFKTNNLTIDSAIYSGHFEVIIIGYVGKIYCGGISNTPGLEGFANLIIVNEIDES